MAVVTLPPIVPAAADGAHAEDVTIFKPDMQCDCCRLHAGMLALQCGSKLEARAAPVAVHQLGQGWQQSQLHFIQLSELINSRSGRTTAAC